MIAFVIFSCQSQDDTLIEKDISVSDVQALYQRLSTSQSNGRQTNDLTILWDEAQYKDVSTRDALVFPIKSSVKKYVRSKGTSTAYLIENQAQAFAYRSDDGTLLLDYVLMIPTSQTESFTGYISVSDWNGEPKHLFKYENGLYIGQPNNGRSENIYCYWIDTETCTVVTSGGFDYPDCEVSSTLQCQLIASPPSIAPGDFSGPGGGGSPGDGSTELCPHPTIRGEFVACDESIVNDLKDECLRGLVFELVNSGLSNELTTAIIDVFGETDSDLNLIFEEDPFLGKLARTAYDSRYGSIQISIRINPNRVSSASKEYISSVVIHELVHAYLYANAFNFNTLSQHQEMAENYINWMINALQEVFSSLTNREAASLAFRGLAAFQNEQPDYFNELIAEYGFSSVADLTNETDKLRDGEKGTQCDK